MRYPNLTEIPRTRMVTETWGGYNHNARINDGEIYDGENLSSDMYPVMSQRRGRGIAVDTMKEPGGIICKDALCWVNDRKLYINGYPVAGLELSLGKKQLVSMGAYLIILPDKKYCNTKDLTDVGSIEAEVQVAANAQVEMTDIEGVPYTVSQWGGTAPEAPADHTYWLDNSGSKAVLQEWSSTQAMWVSVTSVYLKITARNIGKAFKEFDGVDISATAGGALPFELDGSHVIWARDDDWILVVGLMDSNTGTIPKAMTISRKMPAMDFVIESGNRLWGCRYGVANNGEIVNEIYASKLGDFRNWSCYMGVATDSYAVSLGTDGPFTGAIEHLGYPLFFKSDCMHKIYGMYPAQYQVNTTKCRGVQQGSERSLAIVNEVLYYKGNRGVCAFDGSLPQEVSSQLGDEQYSGAVAGAFGNKYYIAMKDSRNRPRLFVLDTKRGIWHREDCRNELPEQFATGRDELYFLSGRKIWTTQGGGTPADGEDRILWEMVTGIIGLTTMSDQYTVADINQKRLSKLVIRLTMEAGAYLDIDIEYDSSGKWESAVRIKCDNLRSYSIPILPKRCDHLRLRLKGAGRVNIYSLARYIEGASDIPNNFDGQKLDF